MEADIVIVGGGPAGLIAAIEACDRGEHTMLFESDSELGGGTIPATGHVALCETDLTPASATAMFEDLAEAHQDADPALLRAYVTESRATFERLRVLGIEFARAVQLAHMSAAWAHEMPLGGQGGGAQIAAALAAAAAARPIRILRETRARRLEPIGNSAFRLWLDGVEGPAEVHARRAVILATGGFTRNPDLIRNFGGPGADRIVPVTAPGSRGDGLLMAMALGAGTKFMTAGIAASGPVDRETKVTVLMNYCGGIIVNVDGHRFCRESEIYNEITRQGMSQPECLMIHLYDARAREAFQATMWARVYAGAREFAGATLPELLGKMSAACGLDAAQAAWTVEGYNAGIARHDDALGRTHLVGETGTLTPLDTPPFYSIVTVPGTTHFNGGLAIDADTRVLDVFGDPIPGLFAAGETTGGFHGTGYMSGSHIGGALTFGRIAGRNACRSPTRELAAC